MSSSISPLSYTQAVPRIAPASSSQNATASSTAAKSGKSIGGVAASENTFLTLLVAQMKNQDPLTPTDSTQFVSELAQFSSLEKLTTIDTNVATMTGSVAPATAASNAASAAASAGLGAAASAAASAGSSSLANSNLTNAINSSGMLNNVTS